VNSGLGHGESLRGSPSVDKCCPERRKHIGLAVCRSSAPSQAERDSKIPDAGVDIAVVPVDNSGYLVRYRSLIRAWSGEQDALRPGDGITRAGHR
jgi:hypothetical protein